MDILGELVSVKPAVHEGPFNLQCKYLSIIVERDEGGGAGGGGGDFGNRTMEESLKPFLFLSLLFERGKRFEQLSCVP